MPDPNKDYPLSAAKIGGYTDGGQLAHPVCLEWREREREGERERESSVTVLVGALVAAPGSFVDALE